MNIKPLIAALAFAGMAFASQATEFKSADTHNADDYPTVVAVKHMSEVLEKLSGGKHKIKVFNKAALGQEKETIEFNFEHVASGAFLTLIQQLNQTDR
jgi:TRAP-type C4-dicarboxylate transport system substrate-binding protein